MWYCENYRVRIVEIIPDKTFVLFVDGPQSVGPSNRISQFADKQSAVNLGNLLANNLHLAIEHGYSLSGNQFLHKDGKKKVHLSNALESLRPKENFISLLEQGEF